MVEPCPLKEMNGHSYRCFFELALAVMGGKWKPIILYHLGREGVQRFSELRRSMPDVTDRMLTRQLRELEADGLITREVYKQVPPRVEYTLTSLGLGLFPLLVTMRDWGAEYEKVRGGASSSAGESYEFKLKPQLHPSYAAQEKSAAQG